MSAHRKVASTPSLCFDDFSILDNIPTTTSPASIKTIFRGPRTKKPAAVAHPENQLWCRLPKHCSFLLFLSACVVLHCPAASACRAIGYLRTQFWRSQVFKAFCRRGISVPPSSSQPPRGLLYPTSSPATRYASSALGVAFIGRNHIVTLHTRLGLHTTGGTLGLIAAHLTYFDGHNHYHAHLQQPFVIDSAHIPDFLASYLGFTLFAFYRQNH